MHGKWSQSGIPHKGWSCSSVEDLGSPEAVCEMCETQEIRYVHYMAHPDISFELGVGCVCAEKMEDDYEGPRKREASLKSAARRKSNWLSRKWSTSGKGNSYLNTDGLNITVFRRDDGDWSARITNRLTSQIETARKKYKSEDEAKLAAFDAMIFLKEKRKWGR